MRGDEAPGRLQVLARKATKVVSSPFLEARDARFLGHQAVELPNYAPSSLKSRDFSRVHRLLDRDGGGLVRPTVAVAAARLPPAKS
jgi:hypothetical protein